MICCINMIYELGIILVGRIGIDTLSCVIRVAMPSLSYCL